MMEQLPETAIEDHLISRNIGRLVPRRIEQILQLHTYFSIFFRDLPVESRSVAVHCSRVSVQQLQSAGALSVISTQRGWGAEEDPDERTWADRMD